MREVRVPGVSTEAERTAYREDDIGATAAVIRGQAKAADFIGQLQHQLGDGDELLRVIGKLPAGELRGFMRGLQKALEGLPR